MAFTAQKFVNSAFFLLLRFGVYDKLGGQVAGSWIGLRKSASCFDIPPSVSHLSRIGWRVQPLSFWPGKNRVG
jgi:hypothetical protein